MIKFKLLPSWNNYYIVSANPNLESQIINPTIPNNTITTSNNKIPRIPIFKNIDDAISGGQFIGKQMEGQVLFVYRVLGLNKDSIIKPTLNDLPYALVIDEYWYLRNIRVKKEKVIEVGKLKKIENYHYGPRSTKANVYRWNWNEQLKPWEKL